MNDFGTFTFYRRMSTSMFLWHRLIKIKNLAGRLLMCHLLNQNACVCMTACVWLVVWLHAEVRFLSVILLLLGAMSQLCSVDGLNNCILYSATCNHHLVLM